MFANYRKDKRFISAFVLADSRMVKGHVTRRSDDPHGQGFGNVKTGFVSSTKLSFLQQASYTLDRDASPAPSNGSSCGGRSKGLRVTWAESPGSSRPASHLGWVDGAAGTSSSSSGMAAAAARAQTPPLAGEWAGSSTGGASSTQMMTSSARMSSNFIQHESAAAANSQTANVVANMPGGQPLVLANQVNSTSSFKSAQQMSFQSSQESSLSAFQSAQQFTGSSITASSSSFSSAKSSSAQVSSFQSGKMFSLQSGKMHTFEAFPGLGEIENLCLEQGERVGK
jgi:hypothetical protein